MGNTLLEPLPFIAIKVAGHHGQRMMAYVIFERQLDPVLANGTFHLRTNKSGQPVLTNGKPKPLDLVIGSCLYFFYLLCYFSCFLFPSLFLL